MESPPSASWRSGRTAALPYPPLLAYLRYHMSIMGFKSFAKIFQFKFRFVFFKVNSAPKPEFTLQIEVFLFQTLPPLPKERIKSCSRDQRLQQ